MIKVTREQDPVHPTVSMLKVSVDTPTSLELTQEETLLIARALVMKHRMDLNEPQRKVAIEQLLLRMGMEVDSLSVLR